MMLAVIDALLIMYNLIIAGIANDFKFSCPSGYIDSNVADVQGASLGSCKAIASISKIKYIGATLCNIFNQFSETFITRPIVQNFQGLSSCSGR